MRFGTRSGTRGTSGPSGYRRSAATSLCAVALAAGMLLAGCTGVDPDRHGAGEKLTEAGEPGGGDQSADRSTGGPGSAEGDARADTGDGPAASGSGGDLVGQRLPELELSWLRTPDAGTDGFADAQAGDPVSLDELSGEPLVINIWATWCTPCRDEIPHLQRLSEQAGNQLRVLGVDHADDTEAARDLLDELKVDYPQLADPDAELKAPFGLRIGIPVTVYVERDGEIAHVARTPYRSVQQLRSDVERYLDVSL